jgi:hypothetical protein
VLKASKAFRVPLVQLVFAVLLVQQDQLVHRDLREHRVHREHKVPLVQLEQLDHKALLDQLEVM